MNKNLIKYGIISIIGIILIYQYLPIGDYCSGLLNFLNSLILVGLLILIVFILSIRNLIQLKRKKKEKFNFIPIILVLFFGTIWYLIIDMPDKKFWTEKSLIGFVEQEGTPKSGTLELFKNNSFSASYHRADYSCTYQGDYEIIDDRLTLKRTDLTVLTDRVFTNEYLINRNDSILIPIKNGFTKISISNYKE